MERFQSPEKVDYSMTLNGIHVLQSDNFSTGRWNIRNIRRIPSTIPEYTGLSNTSVQRLKPTIAFSLALPRIDFDTI